MCKCDEGFNYKRKGWQLESLREEHHMHISIFHILIVFYLDSDIMLLISLFNGKQLKSILIFFSKHRLPFKCVSKYKVNLKPTEAKEICF